MSESGGAENHGYGSGSVGAASRRLLAMVLVTAPELKAFG
jgi:hypothetical protein